MNGAGRGQGGGGRGRIVPPYLSVKNIQAMVMKLRFYIAY